MQVMSKLDERVYAALPYGRENALSRRELCTRLSIPDRELRRSIGRLRAQDNGDGYVIMSTSHHGGYWRTDDINDIRQFYRETSARARSTFRPLRKARRLMHEHREADNG